MTSHAKLRSFWFEKQGIGKMSEASPRQVLNRAGWARSVGGSNPYLTIFARSGAGRLAVDAEVAALEIHELPSARGCTYVLPKDDFALGLEAGRGMGDSQDIATAKKYLGLTDEELSRLEQEVLAAVKDTPLDPVAIKALVGDAVRSFGEDGKRRGMTTSLPLALGRLQANAKIRRVPISGRLDEQRYMYVAWPDSPLSESPGDREEVDRRLAERFFTWAGPATLSEFRTFSGLGVGASNKAVSGLNLVQIDGGELLALPEDADAFLSFTVPKQAAYSLLNALDSLFLLRRNMAPFFDPEDRERGAPTEKGGYTQTGLLADLTTNAIVDRGRIVGLWEYDQPTAELVWWSFMPPNSDLRAAVDLMQRFVAADLGDARSFSLDSPKSRQPKVNALRAASNS